MQQEDPVAKKPRTKRTRKALCPCFVDGSGIVHFPKPTQTQWHSMCINNPEQVVNSPKCAKKFQRRFRMPFSSFQEFLVRSQGGLAFSRWNNKKDAVGNKSPPVGSLLLGAPRHLDRGPTFDDLEEFTSIGEETHRQFFHVFVKCGRETLCPRCIVTPKIAAECGTHQHEFILGGLDGAGFSTDGTNVILW